MWSFSPHDISVILALCDNELPKEVECYGKDIISNNIHDVVNGYLIYEDKYVNLNADWLNPIKEQKMTIVGEKGIIIFDDTSKDNKLKLYPKYIEFLDNVPVPI